MTSTSTFISAIVFARPNIGGALAAELHMATDQPVRVFTTLPIFSGTDSQTTLDRILAQAVIIEAGCPGYAARPYNY